VDRLREGNPALIPSKIGVDKEAMNPLIYADNNATTAIAPEALQAMLPFLREEYFNPSSLYDPAARVAKALQTARQEAAALLGAPEARNLFFTSCATESNNWALFGAAAAAPGRRHVITTAVEHPSVLETGRELARRGFDVTFLGVNSRGELNLDDYVKALRPDTLIVSIMMANNETGVLFPVAELARIAKETHPSILFHTDATQAAGKIPIDLSGDLRPVDLLSFSGHKLHAPKGVGALFVRGGTPLRPLLIGGHQERGRRAGTENVPHIAGFGAACRIARERMDEEPRIRDLRDRLETRIRETVPYLQINGAGAPRLPNTLNLAVHFIEGESILAHLNAFGICASSGSACTSGSLEPSHVLRAMQVPFTAMHGSVRFSFSRYTTPDETDRIAERFPEVVRSLRRISPYWDSGRNEPRTDYPSPRVAPV
jgi:cysteine desulfurase